MSYTLRGRLESRLVAALGPLLVAAALTFYLREWWPLALAGLMIAVGVVLDAAVYHRLLSYQAGWLAVPLGVAELAAVMAFARLAGVGAPVGPALAFFGFSWLLAQLLGHAVFPLFRLSYAEDGGELGRAGPMLAATVLAVLAFSGGLAWGTRPPTIRLDAGVHRGPLVLDEAQTLAGEPGAVVTGGIVVRADDVVVRDVTVVGGETGIAVDGAERVLIEGVTVLGAALDGIAARQSSVTIRDCVVSDLRGEHSQGIDVSFASALAPSRVEGCAVAGGAEGIVSHMTHVVVRDNTVTGTRLRAISLNEMSMGSIDGNDVRGALGIGIFCGDYSECEIKHNRVSGTRSDVASQSRSREGYGIVALYGAIATIHDNALHGNSGGIAAFINSQIIEE
jgi:nitrous oxidase accessory protein NosD